MLVDFDVIIIGSGAAGVQAALPLVEAGLKVAMVDGGQTAPAILEEPIDDFVTMRKERTDQWRWFLGEDVSNIPLGGLDGGHGGGMANGNRSYVSAKTNHELPTLIDDHSTAVQSLASGGLAAAWGATCASLTVQQLTAMGLPANEVAKATKEVEQQIGVSGIGNHLQPPLELNEHMQAVLKRSVKKQASLQQQKLSILRPDAAIVTKNHNGRLAEQYKDMHYFSDEGRSVYRPQWTLEALLEANNFTYISPVIVKKIMQEGNIQCVLYSQYGQKESVSIQAKKILLAAGAIGTGRLLLQSFSHLQSVPLNAKSHAYVVCIDPTWLHKYDTSRRTSVCQLIVQDEHLIAGLPAGIAQLYSYRSLQLFRLLNSVPLPRPQALKALACLVPALTLADVRFTNQAAYSVLSKSMHGVRIQSYVPDSVVNERNNTLRRLKKALRLVRLMPLRTMLQNEGSSSHYAGTCPRLQEQLPVHTKANGSLSVNEHVYPIDSSVFSKLPALPPTLTIMAYARHIGQTLANQMTK